MMFTKKEAYLKTAQGFELKWRQRDKRDKTIAFIIAGIGTAFGLLSLIAIIILLPLKQTNTELYVADKLAGTVEKVTTVEKGELSENSALARYFTQQYVRLREGYDYFRLQHDYDTVQRYGNEVVNKAYLDWWNSPSAPDKVFKDAEYTAEIIFITNFISASSNPDNPDLLSTLRFRKDIRDVRSGNVQPEYWTVRMTWRFEPQQTMTDAPSHSVNQQRVLSYFRKAIALSAFDLHFTIGRDGGEFCYVEVRVHGELQCLDCIDKDEGMALASTIILSMCDVTEKQFYPNLHQDGRIAERFLKPLGIFGARYAHMPDVGGLYVAMRLIKDDGETVPDFETLGFLPEQIRTLKRLLRRPEGMMILSGPTGFWEIDDVTHRCGVLLIAVGLCQQVTDTATVNH
ncbi:VirB8/TrbF family protein [Arsenophonus sp.]|uniref:VirB8/TrbF family protein n=1 Tax=Arsenophonus sp. TaxID=1872640 RepID=UPI002860D04B|nr:VirB8/TrbF family protein [Arsenophonus sp.]MDR5617850.1 VirB8/TrbF family protein [Arsenophonus sp.]